RASAPAASGSVPVAWRPQRSCAHDRSLAWPQPSSRGCKLVGLNPYLSPFNVFGPLTFVCHFWGSVHRSSPCAGSPFDLVATCRFPARCDVRVAVVGSVLSCVVAAEGLRLGLRIY